MKPSQGPRAAKTASARVLIMLALAPLAAAAMVGCGSGSEANRMRPVTSWTNDHAARAGTTATQADSADDPPAPAEDIIRPGDQIQIMVWGHPEFNTTTTVKNYGTIAIPLIGDVIAGGLTERRLSTELDQRLSQYIKGNVRLNISRVNMNNQICVMGAVSKQGNYPVLGRRSLVEIIGDAGGAAAEADLRHVKIIREGKDKQTEEVNLERYLESGSYQDVPTVKPGETVFVPSEENFLKQVAGYGQEILLLFGFFALLR